MEEFMENTIHIRSYKFFFEFVLPWIERSPSKSRLIEKCLSKVMQFIEQRPSPLRIIYKVPGSVRQFVQKASCYEDLNRVKLGLN